MLDSSQYSIPLDLNLLTRCAAHSRQDTWAKLQLLIVRGAADGSHGDHMDKVLLSMLDAWNCFDYVETVCALLHHGANLDAKNDKGLSLNDLLHQRNDVKAYETLDLLYCAVGLEMQDDHRLQDWISTHPRRSSVYIHDYTPFHHLWCRLGRIRWISDTQYRNSFEAGMWPFLEPEEEHVVSHGSYIRRSVERKDGWCYEWARWTMNGEVTIIESREKGLPDEVLNRKAMTSPCADCIIRWLRDTSTSRHVMSGDISYQHVRFVVTCTGGTWDLYDNNNNIEYHPSSASALTSSSKQYSHTGDIEAEQPKNLLRSSDDLDSDIDIRQDHELSPENPTRRRARTTSSLGDEDRVYKRSRLDD